MSDKKKIIFLSQRRFKEMRLEAALFQKRKRYHKKYSTTLSEMRQPNRLGVHF